MTKRSRRSENRREAFEAPSARAARIARASDPTTVDPDHHLWRNGRLWWIAFTVHRGHLQERVRFSLGTDDVEVARRKRDEIFRVYEEAERCRISIRVRPRRGGVASAERRNALSQRRGRL